MLKRFSVLTVLVITCFLFFTCRNNSGTLFQSLPASATGIHFENKLEKHHAFGILYYLYYYNGGGVSIGDVNNDGLPDIYFTANKKGGNKLYINKGNYQFEDVTEKAGVAGSSDWCTGSTMTDINGDGLLDIYVSAVNIRGKLTGKNELFINNGNGTFTESAAKCGLDFSGFSTQTTFFDYDHDGKLDCYILNQSHQPNQNIVDTSNRRKFDPSAGDKLMHNDGATAPGGLPHFTDVSVKAGVYQSSLGYGLGITVADFNNDGWDDIYIGNDFHENDYYYINQKNGTFKEEGAKHFGHYSRFSMGNDAADFNNDGQMDVVTVDMLPPTEKLIKTYGSDEHLDIYNFKILRNGFQDQVSRNCLQRNNGNGMSYSDVALQAGVSATDWSWSPLFADFDNDGKKDLFISSGIVKRPVDMDYVSFVSELASKINRNTSDEFDEETIAKMPDGASHPFLFKGDGKIGFKDMSNDWGTGNMKGYFNGAAYADLNNDGNMDIVMNCLNAPAMLLKNNAPKKNYLSIGFKGDSLNRFGIGAKAYLFNKAGMQFQELMLTRGFMSSSDSRLHFGLDTLTSIDSILIVWPSQKFQVIKNIVANKPLTVLEKEAAGQFNYADFFAPKKENFIDISAQVNCNWKHQENNFNDFDIQPLIPHKESTRGPKIAVGDVNKDGLDDFYACGAKGQPGALMIQQKDGSFQNSDTSVFSFYAPCEDVDAVFFDANGDGWQDLLVISGGGEPQTGSPFLLTDRLYMNDGKGHFTSKKDFLVQKFYNKSCVAVADVNHDGFPDIFIGTLENTYGKDFGKPETSYLFLNDGKAKFNLTDYTTIQLSNVGNVTTAVFADVNKDGWPDLIVTGEWMPIKIFINHQGKFTEQDIPNSTGLWQNIVATDINGDGNMDLLAGNWGHNSKLWAGKNGPLKMYVKDFDNNGTTEQVMCYTVDGKEYTFLGKDELEKTLPILKKAYLKYGEVAGQTVQYMFYDLFKDYQELKAATLSSASFLNDGKGDFVQKDLPDQLQLAPIFSFTPIAEAQFIAAGNFSGVLPYEGRYDALFPSTFLYDNKTNNFNYQNILPNISGEVRDIKWIKTINGKRILAIARNNDKIVFLKEQ